MSSIIRPTLVSPAVFFANLPAGYMTPPQPYSNLFEGRIVVLGDDEPSAFYLYANFRLIQIHYRAFLGQQPAGANEANDSPNGSEATSAEIPPADSSEGSTAPSSPLNLGDLRLDEPESPISSTEGLNGSSGGEADDEGEPQVVEEDMDWEDNV
ncbi:hypothetical protein B9Z55_007388 [Caenorhabditis nigoni]|uniref:Uncharacterized protein n=1 Tax=Caenorhabditis nigoni TaxID=1611254 RepID=A0A2G5V9L4_9PELO|nr:hypothetical protein B9Z55_007388 [Caenorhabditis nigoni]